MIAYEFTNFTTERFTGRFGGVDYTFEAGETRRFDPDKHYMLIILAKQLADRELVKKIKQVGRDPKDTTTWGKSLDEFGNIFNINSEMRKAVMRDAIGSLVDTPVPTPDDEVHTSEAGATHESETDVQSLKDQVRELSEMVQSFSQQASKSVVQAEAVAEPEPVGMTREALESIAADIGIVGTSTMTKEELIQRVSSAQSQI